MLKDRNQMEELAAVVAVVLVAHRAEAVAADAVGIDGYYNPSPYAVK